MPLKISRTDLRRLARLEARAPAPEDDGRALASVKARLEAMARRVREAPDWREPTEAEVAEIRERLAAYIAAMRAEAEPAR